MCGATAVLATGVVVGGGLAVRGVAHHAPATPMALTDSSTQPVGERGVTLSRSFDRTQAIAALGPDGRHPGRVNPRSLERHFRVVARQERIHAEQVRAARLHAEEVRAERVHAERVAEREAASAASSAPAEAPAPATQATAAAPAAPTSVVSALEEIAQCESGGNWSDNTGNGYYGGLQFSLSTWQAYGGSGLPSDASKTEQIAVAARLVKADGGYGSWPACSQRYGLPQ